MILFNNSEYRGYVLHHIIPQSTIYTIDNFEEKFVNYIRATITNPDVIQILNKMFSPINGPSRYAEKCSEYESVLFTHLGGNGSVIYNNDILDREYFFEHYKMRTFGDYDIVLLQYNVEYNEQLIREK